MTKTLIRDAPEEHIVRFALDIALATGLHGPADDEEITNLRCLRQNGTILLGEDARNERY
jgi:hypothetical protein